LSAIFVDYDNIYLSLRRKSEDAAKRFAKLAGVWLKGIETGRLVSTTAPLFGDQPRRIVSVRCYGNPVPRRQQSDNVTDMSSFPFVRHHFLRAGFEVIDCPPLTSHQKNAADIRMVMDLRDFLTHDTYFDEFVILSDDADFTPVLHRLRQHARRTVIYSNDHTASAYSAISDGEVREMDLIATLLSDVSADAAVPVVSAPGTAPMAGRAEPTPTGQQTIDELRRDIIAEVVSAVRSAQSPAPLEALADRALRTLGHDRTIGTAWAGAGTFRDLLKLALPASIQISEHPPYVAYDVERHLPVDRALEGPPRLEGPRGSPATAAAGRSAAAISPPVAPAPLAPRSSPEPGMHRGAPTRATVAPAPPTSAPRQEIDVQRAMTRIQEASQVPPLSSQGYAILFEIIADEIARHGISGAQTVTQIFQAGIGRGIAGLKRQDVQFVMDVIGEADPWFENIASASVFATRFRNFVVARCREHDVVLSMKELDLIDAWFMGADLPAGSAVSLDRDAQPAARHPLEPKLPAEPQRSTRPGTGATTAAPAAARHRWWTAEETKAPAQPDAAAAVPDDELPLFVRQRR
jgi:hypothetical protein